MKYETVFKVSKALIQEDTASLLIYTKNQGNYFKRKLLKKSIRLLNDVVELLDQGSINQNKVTVSIKFDGYKVPRIIKHKLKHFYGVEKL